MALGTLHIQAGNLVMPSKMHLAILFLLLNCLAAPVAPGNVVLIITDDQDSTLDGMVERSELCYIYNNNINSF